MKAITVVTLLKLPGLIAEWFEWVLPELLKVVQCYFAAASVSFEVAEVIIESRRTFTFN